MCALIKYYCTTNRLLYYQHTIDTVLLTVGTFSKAISSPIYLSHDLYCFVAFRMRPAFVSRCQQVTEIVDQLLFGDAAEGTRNIYDTEKMTASRKSSVTHLFLL
jgi:hypothetical protein